MARAQICMCTARKDGVKNANSDTQMRAVNPGLIVHSAHWLQCAAASPPLFYWAAIHPGCGTEQARTGRGSQRSSALTQTHRGCLRARQQTNAKIQRAISAIMAWRNSLQGRYYQLRYGWFHLVGGWACAGAERRWTCKQANILEGCESSVKISLCKCIQLLSLASPGYFAHLEFVFSEYH